jgi:Fur family transcriptional regulator, ferric uptake regulator
MPRLPPDEAAALLERFRRQLREKRLPVTRQRLAVAAMVFGAPDHPSVMELTRRLASAGETIGTATLYRTLEVLVRMGLVRERDFGEGYTRYEPSAAEAHDHLICDRCGVVVEFAGDRVERMLRVTADEQRFLYRHHHIEIHGLCQACRGRDLSPPASGVL